MSMNNFKAILKSRKTGKFDAKAQLTKAEIPGVIPCKLYRQKVLHHLCGGQGEVQSCGSVHDQKLQATHFTL